MSSVAIVKVGTHQYRVQENSVFEVERFERPEGAEAKLDQVLFVDKDGQTQVGQPVVENAAVFCEVLSEIKTPKTISYKFKRRKNYRRKVGHRQSLLRLRVKSIQAG